MPTLASYYLGIDTGGTFTDGVLFDPQTRKVVKSTKVLTTHYDLKICISQVLEQLIQADPPAISLISLSTTLATNAIAEGKRKPVALLLLGYDPELVDYFQFNKQFGTEHYYFVKGRHDLNGVEQFPLDQTEIKRIITNVREKVYGVAIASYAGPMNSDHETCAANIIASLTKAPIVQAHHLSSELDSIRRATTASINASLLSNIHDFLDAIQHKLVQRGVKCPIMVVKGDGSIVKSDFARHRPIEMIHSGPATSAIGGQFLAGVDTAIVVDIGGTTTDITLVDRGKVQLHEQSATVGSYRTCVKTIKAHSFGLGGDSLIAFDHYRNLSVGPERVVPISRFCHQYPEIKRELSGWISSHPQLRYSDELEYWILRHAPKQPIEDKSVKAIVELLRQRPYRMWEIKKRVGPIPPVFMRELINLEIIDRTGLTPTDLLHITGEFSPWDREIAELVTDLAARLWHENTTDFIFRVKKMMTHKIVAEIIQFLSDKTFSDNHSWHHQLLDRWLFEESLDERDPYLGCDIFLKMPIVGIGAPAKAFLPAVAQALGTQIIFPDHYEVANAVGTVVGNVIIRHEGDVLPCIEGAAITGYYSRALNQQQKFERFEEALKYTKERLAHQASQDILAAGAEIAAVECEEKKIFEGMMHLSAWAVGKPVDK